MTSTIHPQPPAKKRTPPPLAQVAMNHIVRQELHPQLDYFFQKLVDEKENTTIDGVVAMRAKEKFLPGKIAIGLSYLLLETPQDDPKFSAYCSGFRDIADLTINAANDTWGIYFYALAIYKLKMAGLLEQAIAPATLATLKVKLDWRIFVTEPDYSLIKLPTNYYGVAFSIARLRMLMGWEDETSSNNIMEKMLSHYGKYSGEYGFSDETEGEGRFDRYSILLIAEICQRCIETGVEVTPTMRKWLRKSATLVLNIANTSGDGFSFGRTIGAYGETAVLEILSVAAYLDVLDQQEKEYAYAYCTTIVAKYVEFWYDPSMRSVNLWEKGRRTDNYRNKSRILGENLSLLHHLIYTNNLWNAAGFKDRVPVAGLQAWLNRTQPKFTLTWFARGEYDRALAIVRDRQLVFSLLMVNGGTDQHGFIPYFPLPFANGIIASSPDSHYPQLIPHFLLEDGSELQALSYFKNITSLQLNDHVMVSYQQDELDRLGAEAPIKDRRITLKTSYTFAPGCITRTDTYSPAAPIAIRNMSMEFASFSQEATCTENAVSFAQGSVTSFEISGMTIRGVSDVDANTLYNSPCGSMKSRILCQKDQFVLAQDLVIRWVIRYR